MKNNKKINIIVSIILILIIGVAAWFLFRKEKTDNIKADTATVKLGEKVTLENADDLTKQGKSFQCSGIVNLSGGNSLSSVFYFSPGKYAQQNDLTINGKGETTNAYIVDDGQYYYSWGNTTDSGSKIKSKGVTSSVADILKKLPDVSCYVWELDLSKFTPPTNINWHGEYNGSTDSYNPVQQ